MSQLLIVLVSLQQTLVQALFFLLATQVWRWGVEGISYYHSGEILVPRHIDLGSGRGEIGDDSPCHSVRSNCKATQPESFCP